MSPVILGLSAYRLFVVVAAAVGIAATILLARRARVPMGAFLGAYALLVIVSLVGARLHAVLDVWGRTGVWTSMLSRGGLRYPGGMLAVIVTLPLLARVTRGRVTMGLLGDLMAPAAALAMATVRVGCLLHGCCYGPPTWLPWGLRFPSASPAWAEHVSAGLVPPDAPASLPVHPLQLYLLVWSLLVSVYLFRRWSRRRFDGEILLVFLVLHEGGKFLLEFLRMPEPLPHLQVPALGLAVVGAVGLAVARRRRHRRHAVA